MKKHFMEPLKAFDERALQISNTFEDLKVRQVEVKEKLDKLSKKPSLENISASKLLSGNVKTFSTEKEDLEDELKHINNFIESTSQLGGVAAICKTDEEMERLALELVESLKLQLKDAAKKKADLENRYEKILSEIALARKEREDFEKEWEQVKEVQARIMRRTNVPIIQEAVTYYSLSKPRTYQHIDKATTINEG
jgi:chromosome segregation ATPase